MRRFRIVPDERTLDWWILQEYQGWFVGWKKIKEGQNKEYMEKLAERISQPPQELTFPEPKSDPHPWGQR